MNKKIKLCYYRDHICQVVEEHGDNDVDLKILAEPLVDGGIEACECTRDGFYMVKVFPSEMIATKVTV